MEVFQTTNHGFEPGTFSGVQPIDQLLVREHGYSYGLFMVFVYVCVLWRWILHTQIGLPLVGLLGGAPRCSGLSPWPSG